MKSEIIKILETADIGTVGDTGVKRRIYNINELAESLIELYNLHLVSVAKRKVCFNENCYYCKESTLTCESINYLQCSKKQTFTLTVCT